MTDAKGMRSTIVTLEDKEAEKELEKLKAERKCINAILLSSILLVFLAVICFGVVMYRTSKQISEITATQPATEEIDVVSTPATEEEKETVPDFDTDFYHEDIPLRYAEQRDLYEASKEFGVDYYTMLGLIERETNFRNTMGDNGKAYGYCQVWLKWWGDAMRDIGGSDLLIPKDNFRTACAIVAELTDRYGSLEGALTAYNKGSYNGTVTEYARSVLENAEKWRSSI
jgi:soluble lytic murein transglycosylase-like protein